VLLFLLGVFSLGLVTESEAMVATRRITIPNLKFTADGQAYKVREQTFSTRCDSDYCYFKADDYNLRVPVENVEIHEEERTYNPTYFTPRTYTGDDGELSDPEYTQGYISQRPTGEGASEHLECYQNLRDSYTSRHCPNVTSLGSINGCQREGSKARDDSLGWCARYVRFILTDCGVLPAGSIARRAENGGPALESQGFRRLSTLDPSQAPLGSIIIYSGTCPAIPASADPGHIEIKTGPNEYTSDYVSNSARSTQTACRRVTGIYFK